MIARRYDTEGCFIYIYGKERNGDALIGEIEVYYGKYIAIKISNTKMPKYLGGHYYDRLELRFDWIEGVGDKELFKLYKLVKRLPQAKEIVWRAGRSTIQFRKIGMAANYLQNFISDCNNKQYGVGRQEMREVMHQLLDELKMQKQENNPVQAFIGSYYNW